MPYVFVLNGSERCRAFYLTKDATLLGQRDDADVVLKDPWISWTHARIHKEGNDFSIEDLGSTNGTYVNCERVKRAALRDEDVVFLGRTHLLFVASDRTPSAPPPGPREPPAGRLGVTDRLEASANEFDLSPVVGEEPDVLPGSLGGELVERGQARPPGEETVSFRGPFEPLGRIKELDQPEPLADALAPLAPVREGPSVRAGNAAGAIEIDVADLLDSDGKALSVEGRGRSSGRYSAAGTQALAAAAEAQRRPPPAGKAADPAAAAPAPPDVQRPPDAGLDPIASRDREIERLREALAARDSEIRRLRNELTRLKEQYLDL